MSAQESEKRLQVKFSPKGHDAQLMRAQDAGARVVIRCIDGETAEGRIRRRDRYTITLWVDGEDRIYYKHAIKSVTIRNEQCLTK